MEKRTAKLTQKQFNVWNQNMPLNAVNNLLVNVPMIFVMRMNKIESQWIVIMNIVLDI